MKQMRLLLSLGWLLLIDAKPTLPVHPGGIGGLFKGPNSETIIKGPDGSVITAAAIGGAIETEGETPAIVVESEVISKDQEKIAVTTIQEEKIKLDLANDKPSQVITIQEQPPLIINPTLTTIKDPDQPILIGSELPEGLSETINDNIAKVVDLTLNGQVTATELSINTASIGVPQLQEVNAIIPSQSLLNSPSTDFSSISGVIPLEQSPLSVATSSEGPLLISPSISSSSSLQLGNLNSDVSVSPISTTLDPLPLKTLDISSVTALPPVLPKGVSPVSLLPLVAQNTFRPDAVSTISSVPAIIGTPQTLAGAVPPAILQLNPKLGPQSVNIVPNNIPPRPNIALLGSSNIQRSESIPKNNPIEIGRRIVPVTRVALSKDQQIALAEQQSLLNNGDQQVANLNTPLQYTQASINNVPQVVEVTPKNLQGPNGLYTSVISKGEGIPLLINPDQSLVNANVGRIGLNNPQLSLTQLPLALPPPADINPYVDGSLFGNDWARYGRETKNTTNKLKPGTP